MRLLLPPRRWLPLAGLIASACAAPAPEPDLQSPVPAERLRALEADPSGQPATARDLALLIEQLNSGDAAVRMLAGDRLRRVTGEDFGFRYDAPAPERSRAIQRWVDWLRERGPAGESQPPETIEPDDA